MKSYCIFWSEEILLTRSITAEYAVKRQQLTHKNTKHTLNFILIPLAILLNLIQNSFSLMSKSINGNLQTWLQNVCSKIKPLIVRSSRKLAIFGCINVFKLIWACSVCVRKVTNMSKKHTNDVISNRQSHSFLVKIKNLMDIEIESIIEIE